MHGRSYMWQLQQGYFCEHVQERVTNDAQPLTLSAAQTSSACLNEGSRTTSVCVPVEHVNERGRKGMWSKPPQIKNIHCLCACVQGEEGEGKQQEKSERGEGHSFKDSVNKKPKLRRVKSSVQMMSRKVYPRHSLRVRTLMRVRFTPAKWFKFSHRPR